MVGRLLLDDYICHDEHAGESHAGYEEYLGVHLLHHRLVEARPRMLRSPSLTP